MNCQDIKEYLEEYSGLDISTKSRKSKYIMFRSLYFFFCVRYSSEYMSYSDIALKVKLDHAGLINGLKSFESFFASNAKFREDFTRIKKHIIENSPKKFKQDIDRIEDMSVEKLKGQLLKFKRLNSEKNKKIYSLEYKLKRIS